MLAVTFDDENILFQQRPDPEPGTGELLVAVRSAGLNGGDLLQRRGLYPAPPGAPEDIPGLEFAGEVMACGPGAQRFSAGDRVMAIVGGGAQAERVVVHERCALPVPDAVSFEEAGGFPEAFITAHDALFTQCHLGMGERVAIRGAAGGVGSAAVQLAAASGAEVVAVVRDRERRHPVGALGATAIAPEDFAAHGPYDVILELIGGPNLDDDVKALRPQGRVVVIGVGAGAKGQVNLLALMGVRGSIHASTLRARPLEAKATATRAVEHHVLPLLGAGRIRVPVLASYAMADAEAAYARFAAGGKFGKIVLSSTA